MNRILKIIGVSVGLIVVVSLFVIYHYRVEHYAIMHTAFLTPTNKDVLLETVCYSNKELKNAIKSDDLLAQAGMKSYNLDEPDLMACVVSNYTVEKVVGRQNFWPDHSPQKCNEWCLIYRV